MKGKGNEQHKYTRRKMIRKYRKAANLTLQQLADAIHKSRATICKYENGDISIDIETLYEISQVLQVSVPQLTDIGRLQAEADHSSAYAARKSPFFQAKMLYFYFYDGRYNRMKDGVINIHEKKRMVVTVRRFLSVPYPGMEEAVRVIIMEAFCTVIC